MKQYTSQEFLSKIFLTKFGLFHQGFFTIATCTNTSTRCTMNGKHPLASSYAHPVENIMTTYIAGSAGALVSKATIPVAWLW